MSRFDGSETRRFDVNGVEILARVPTTARGKRPALLLLHGFPQSHVIRRLGIERAGLHRAAGAGRIRTRLLHPRSHPQRSGTVTGQALSAGHFIPEELPQETAGALLAFFDKKA